MLIKKKPYKSLSSAIDDMICIRNTNNYISLVEKTSIVFIVCSGHKLMNFTDLYTKQKKKSLHFKLQNLNAAGLNKRRIQ